MTPRPHDDRALVITLLATLHETGKRMLPNHIITHWPHLYHTVHAVALVRAWQSHLDDLLAFMSDQESAMAFHQVREATVTDLCEQEILRTFGLMVPGVTFKPRHLFAPARIDPLARIYDVIALIEEVQATLNEVAMQATGQHKVVAPEDVALDSGQHYDETLFLPDHDLPDEESDH